MNAIVYLTRSSEIEVRQLIRSIHLLAENFLPSSPADIFVFHEKGFDNSAIVSDPVAVRLGVRFCEVDFSSAPAGTENLSPGQRGYRHMCHFFANDVFFRKELNAYDYQMRLDVDSYILSNVRFNVFNMMRNENVQYVYRMVMKEKKAVARGLLEAAESFFARHPELDRRKKRLRTVKLYYTNFEICDLKWFRGEAWQSYFRAIDEAGGIYGRRWGDAPIRWLGLQHLLDPRNVRCLQSMAYFHAFKLEKGFTFRMPWEYIRYSLSVLRWLMRSRPWVACGRVSPQSGRNTHVRP